MKEAAHLILLACLAAFPGLAFAEAQKNPWADPDPPTKEELHYTVEARYEPGGSWQLGGVPTTKAGAMSTVKRECAPSNQPWTGNAVAVRINNTRSGSSEMIRCEVHNR
ncbi:MAG: hypothetical protein RJQ08_08370 [Salinisphaeraceae bacterium]